MKLHNILLFTALLMTSTYAENTTDVAQDVTETSKEKSKIFQLKDHLNREKIGNKFLEALDSIDISTDVKVFDFDILDGLNIRAKYDYEVEKSYLPGKYSRKDELNFNFKGSVSKQVSDSLNLPIFLNLNRSNKVSVVRQFDKKGSALTALPFNFSKLPIRAKNAKLLDKGDFISIPANMTLTTGFNFSHATNIINFGVSSFFAMSGEFLIQLYKLEDSKIRVKIVSQKKRSRGASAKGKLGFELFSFDVLGQEIDKDFKLEWLKINASRTEGNIILADYIFDLEDEDVANLYNRLFLNIFKFKETKLFTESFNSKLLDKYYVVNLEDVDAIAYNDRNSKTPRIDRIFKGNNKYKSKQRGVYLDFKFLELGAQKNFVDNRFNYERIDGDNVAFFYPSYNKTREKEIDILIFSADEKQILSYYGLTSTNDDYNFLNIGLNFLREDNELRTSELKRFKKILAGTLPFELKKTVPDAISDKNHQINFNSKISLILKKEAFAYYDQLELKFLQKRLAEHLRGKKFFPSLNSHPNRKNQGVNDRQTERAYIRKVNKLAKKMFDILKSDIEHYEKVDQFVNMLRKLKKEYLIIQYLCELLPENELDKYVYLDIYIGDDKGKLVDHTVGENNYLEVYKQLEYLNRYITGDEEDLRIDHRTEEIQSYQTSSK